ncbi:integrase-like protein [Microbacterium saperdae]|uniref:Integrase-like protein n=1 Tax=Microbacterium saperdae TaxID=69368 RepID=A0A543BLD6_9MICO|nr:integrase-like protein [Microbacterium saperdae]
MGVESICAVLTQHGVKIAPSTYYDARGRGPSSQTVSDERWKPIILAAWQAHRKVLGARKLWLRLRRDGHDIARCTVERLMRELGIAGVLREKRKRPVDTDPRETRPADLVDRHFARFRTNQLWVADFTYVWTWSGWVYVAFVFDAHSRRIIGWRAATSMTTALVLDCLDMALFTRRREGVTPGSRGSRTTPTRAASTPQSPSPTGSSTKASTRPSGPSATPTTTLSRSRRSGSTSPNSSTTKVPGGTSIRSRRRPHPGCSGSTPNAPMAPSTTSHPSRSSNSTTLATNRLKEPADTSKQLSGHAGASQGHR